METRFYEVQWVADYYAGGSGYVACPEVGGHFGLVWGGERGWGSGDRERRGYIVSWGCGGSGGMDSRGFELVSYFI